MTWLEYLIPWEFSPLMVLMVLGSAVLYYRGLSAADDKTVSLWQVLAFYIGLLSIYIVSHTYVDYLSQYMFWVHRFQHLVLHHLAPLLLVLGAMELMAKGSPIFLPQWSSIPLIIRWPFEVSYRFIQHPVVAPIVFVGLIYFWLMPDIHFAAMLNPTWYQVMNWSMLIDGVLFWYLVLGPDWQGEAKGFKTRIAMMMVVVVPQQLLGAYLTLSGSAIYDVYDVCGRAWPISAEADQIYGGIVTWIPASMMSVLGLVLVIRRRMIYLKATS